MTRVAAAWNACNRVLDERWHESQWQAHRDRIELIQSASSVSAQAFSSALAASARPRRIHTSRANWNSSSPVKLVARSKSPAAKSRQKQIDHDNLVLIKKIVALDNAKSSGAKKRRKSSQSHSKAATARSHDKIKNAIVVPKPAHANHECLQPLPETPQSAACHVLYTRGSATMKNNFVEYNAPTMMHASNATSAAARVRSRAQSKILVENKKILRRILSARTTVDRSALQQHEEKHNRLLSIMSRHHSTPRLPQQQSQPQALRTSRSQRNFATGGVGITDSGIRVDPTSHLTKPRPRSASHASSRARVAATCPQSLHTARRSASSESLVSRIRKMTLESQRDGM